MNEGPRYGLAGDDRRLHYRALAFWQDAAADKEFPALAEIDPAKIDFLADQSFVIDVSGGIEAPMISYSGKTIDDACGESVIGKISTDLPGHTVFFHLADHFVEVIANRAPISFEAEYTTIEKIQRRYRGILLPTSETGSAITAIVGVLGWIDGKESNTLL